MGDYYWYGSGVRRTVVSGGYNVDNFCGPLLFHEYEALSASAMDTGSSGIREYSSMSSQVPTANGGWISDIAFESNYPYSLHPTAVNDSINVGDYYWFTSGVTITDVGGAYSYGDFNGAFAIGINLAFTFSRDDFGSSGIREYSSMSSQVPETDDEYISDISFEVNHPYSLHPTELERYTNTGGTFWYNDGSKLTNVGASYREKVTYSSPFTFGVWLDFDAAQPYVGSSGYP